MLRNDLSVSDGGMYVSNRHNGFCFVVMYGEE